MNWFMIIICTIALLYILMLIFDSEFRKINNPGKTNKENLDKLIKESQFKGVTSFRSYNNSCSAILNEDEEKLHVFYSVKQDKHKIHTYKQRTINFYDILLSEVIIDNTTVTSTARGSQVASALVGGAILGGVGAIIGGLSGKTSSIENVKKIDIKLTLNDLNDPISKINFLDGDDISHFDKKKGFKKESKEYRHAISEVEKWQGIFDVILRNQDQTITKSTE